MRGWNNKITKSVSCSAKHHSRWAWSHRSKELICLTVEHVYNMRRLPVWIKGFMWHVPYNWGGFRIQLWQSVIPVTNEHCPLLHWGHYFLKVLVEVWEKWFECSFVPHLTAAHTHTHTHTVLMMTEWETELPPCFSRHSETWPLAAPGKSLRNKHQPLSCKSHWQQSPQRQFLAPERTGPQPKETMFINHKWISHRAWLWRELCT